MTAMAMLLASPLSAQDWSGQWGGFALGYGAGSYEQGDFEADETGEDVDVDGFLVGLHYERNFQRGNHVLGFDVGLSKGVRGTSPQEPGPVWWACELGECFVNVEALLTLRGRYGWLMTPETMIYGAGGLAAGKVEGGIYNFTQNSSTAVGYTIGAGLAHMIQPNLMLYAEVNHVDLGTLELGPLGTPDDTLDGRGDFSTVLIGVNFRF